MKCAVATGIALFPGISYERSDCTIGSGDRNMMNGINDELILAARLLLATLFLVFGWRKVRDYSGTLAQMVQLGLPMPVLATIGSIFMELPVAFALPLARSRVPRPHSWLCTRWEQRLSGIATGW